MEKQIKCPESMGTVLHAAADFAKATYIGSGQLTKRDSARKG